MKLVIASKPFWRKALKAKFPTTAMQSMPAHSDSGKLLKECIQFLQTLKVFSSLSFNLFYLGFISPFGFILYPLISMVYTNSSLKLQKLLKATVHYFS